MNEHYRDFCLIMLGIAIQMFSTWLVAKLNKKTHEFYIKN